MNVESRFAPVSRRKTTINTYTDSFRRQTTRTSPMLRILHVVGARPNFMKIAPIHSELTRHAQEVHQKVVHTGQHYDHNMSAVFFDELQLPKPDFNLEVGSASHAAQTGLIMQRFEPILLDYQPDWIVVPGDVNSTLACALVAAKLGVKVAHVEAGLRSFDRTMPEEINRVLTDQVSDLLFIPSRDARENLLREGIAAERIRFAGNVMIDSLVLLLPRIEALWPAVRDALGIERYVLVTLHRPSNVDDPMQLAAIVNLLCALAADMEVVFPVHPRTRQQLHELLPPNHRIILTDPLGYLKFLALQAHAAVVLTDSGGVQEETTFLGVPCLTLRPNTERPITIAEGTNQLVDPRDKGTERLVRALLERPPSAAAKSRPELWDGRAATRIVRDLREYAMSAAR